MNDQPTSTQQATKNAVYVLLAFAAVTGIVAGWKIYEAWQVESVDRWQYYPLLFWGGFNAITGLAAAWWARTYRPPEDLRDEETSPTKVLILSVGGMLGFLTVVLGVWYGYMWWSDLTKSRAAWGELKTWIPVLLVLGGLAVMLVAVVIVRSEERRSVVFRRLIYGYNAVLMGLLVFAILGVGNVMASIYAVHPFDWTASSLYSISDQGKRILESMEAPVKVYVRLSPRDPLYSDVKTLLDTCKSYTDKLDEDFVADRSGVRMLMTEYDLQDTEAIVVVYDPENAQGRKAFEKIKDADLVDESGGMGPRGGQPERKFKGERALMQALKSLNEGKITQTIYVTQNSGEMKLDEFSARGDRPGRPDRGLGALKGRLEKAGYKVLPLQLGELDEVTKEPAKVPTDAFAVIVAAPTNLGDPVLATAKIKVLEEYMKRKDGRMIVILEARQNREGIVQPTGLEGFLTSFGVKVGNDMILHEPFRNLPDPAQVIIGLDTTGERSLLEALGPSGAGGFALIETRSVQPATGAAGFTTKPLLRTMSLLRDATGQWPEEQLRGDPAAFIASLEKEKPDELSRRKRSPQTSVAVTVRDASSPTNMPDDQFHARARPSDGAPRMVVIGSSTFASNTATEAGRGNPVYYDLMTSSLAWLRGGDKGAILTEIPERTRNNYQMNTKPDDVLRVLFLPGLVLVIGIVGSGVIVLGFLRRR
jgi:hypothetical protein